MFVKIVKGGDTSSHKTSLYECVAVSHHTDIEMGIEVVLMEPPNPTHKSVTTGLHCQIRREVYRDVPESVAIYVLSDTGRTVDTLFKKGVGHLFKNEPEEEREVRLREQAEKRLESAKETASKTIEEILKPDIDRHETIEFTTGKAEITRHASDAHAKAHAAKAGAST